MSVLVATDLDHTLIYSRAACGLVGDPGRGLVCVEKYDGSPVSFMTAGAAAAISALARATTLVPVTTRIPRQYERVRLPGLASRYAVAANGAVLYVDGVIDTGWSARVTRTLAGGFGFTSVREHVAQLCHPGWTERIHDADGLFCYAIVRRDRLPSGFVADAAGWAADRGWRVSLQGRKLYWVPAALEKGAAVAEVARRAGASLVLAAGDSRLDVDLLLGADRGIVPRHGELFEQGWSAPHVTRTAASGVSAGEQILRWFAARISAAGAAPRSAAAGARQAQEPDAWQPRGRPTR